MLLSRIGQKPGTILPILCIVMAVLLVAGIMYLPALGAIVPEKIAPVIVVAIALAPLLLYYGVKHPLIFPFAGYAAFMPFDQMQIVQGGGLTLSRIFGVLCGAVFLFSLIMRRRAGRPRRPLLMWSLLILWMLASATWAVSMDRSLGDLTQYIQLFTLYALVSIMPIEGIELRIILGIVVIAASIASCYNLYLYRTAVAQNEFRVVLGDESGGSVLDPNHYAAATQLPMILSLVAALRTKVSLRKFLYLGAFLILLAGSLTTGSRGGLLAITTAGTYLLIRLRYRRQLMGFAAFALMVTFAIPSVWQRINDPSQGQGAGRYSIWHIGWEALKQHWLIGAGVGNFQTVFQMNFLKVYQPSNFMTSQNMVSHNLLLGQTTELGVIGLCLLVAAWVTQFRTLRVIPRDTPMFDLRTALEAALIALLSEALFLDVMTKKYVWFAFMLVTLARAYWDQNCAVEYARSRGVLMLPNGEYVVPAPYMRKDRFGQTPKALPEL